MPAWDELLLDKIFRRARIFLRIEDLLFRGDVIRLPGEQKDGAADAPEVTLATQADERAIRESVFHK